MEDASEAFKFATIEFFLWRIETFTQEFMQAMQVALADQRMIDGLAKRGVTPDKAFCLPLTAATAQMYNAVMASDLGEADQTIVIKLLEQLSGIRKD